MIYFRVYMEMNHFSYFSSLFFLAAALCADSFTASFVYGAGNVRIPPLSAGIITLVSSAILVSSMAAGSLLTPFLSPELPTFLSSSLFVLLGCSKLTAPATKELTDQANKKEPEVLSSSESLFLAIGLSIDNAAAGLGAGLAKSPALPLLFLSLILSFLSIDAGGRLGKRAGALIRTDFSRYGGIVLVILGLLKLI